MAAPESLTTQYRCPSCGAKYEVVQIETHASAISRDVKCLGCGGALKGRDGEMALKYFLVERPGGREVFQQVSDRRRSAPGIASAANAASRRDTVRVRKPTR
jgi:hypothetical protein